MAALPSSATATVWTAAANVPNRELMTPVARNNWNVSAGMRNTSSRNGTAALRLPKNDMRPGQCQPRVFRHSHGRARKPSREENEAQRQQLSGMREIERGRDDDVRKRRRPVVDGVRAHEQSFARLDQNRQHDEQVAGDECSDQGIAGWSEDLTVRNRRQRRHQAGDHPHGHAAARWRRR